MLMCRGLVGEVRKTASVIAEKPRRYKELNNKRNSTERREQELSIRSVIEKGITLKREHRTRMKQKKTMK